MEISQVIKTPLFASLPEEEAQGLVDAFQAREYAEDALLFEEDDLGDSFYLVLDGEIKIVKAEGTPEERVLSVVSTGDYIGEMSLLYPEGRRSASARTRTPVRILEMTRADFESFLHRNPRLALEFVRVVSTRMLSNENALVHDLKKKNRQLAKANRELKAAQAQLIEQEKIAHELEIARQIQASLLPKELPELPNWHIAAYWKPANAVGGDFYDFIEFPNGRLGIVVGDVSGKGVPAALVMATTRSVFHAVVERQEAPGAVLERVNELLYPDMPPKMFVTCLYALLDPASGMLDFANAGHNLPCLCSPDEVVELRATGMPLGLMPGMSYEQKQKQLTSSHAVLMYSDGISEAHNSDREMFGMEGLVNALTGCLSSLETKKAQSLIPCLLDKVGAFTGPDWEQEDDVTVLSLEPNGS